MNYARNAGVAGPRLSRWLVRFAVLAAVLLTAGWMVHDPAWTTRRLEGIGTLHVLGITEGRVHSAPGLPGWLDDLPESWRDAAARHFGYYDVTWKASSTSDEVLVWCEWKLENPLPPGGWFEPALVDPTGQIVALGNYPKVSSRAGTHVEPIRFQVPHIYAGSVLQIRRFQPGSPFRDVVAQVKLPGY